MAWLPMPDSSASVSPMVAYIVRTGRAVNPNVLPERDVSTGARVKSIIYRRDADEASLSSEACTRGALGTNDSRMLFGIRAES